MLGASLSHARVTASLAGLGARLGCPLTVLESTPSTNDDARRAAQEGAPHGALFVADQQTAGRGRGGHRWHSPRGVNVYLSLVWRPRDCTVDVAPLALAAGLAVARTVDAALETAHADLGSSRIKWPNDVYVRERKIAGVLLEAFTLASKTAVVIGIGLNVLVASFPEELACRATSLALEAPGIAFDRNQLAARLVCELERACGSFEAAGLAELLGELAARDFLRGRTVSVGQVRGVARGIDERGRLTVEADDGAIRAILSGEVCWT